jgi:hypothetical protein
MKIAKAAAILVLGPLLGIFLGFIIGALASSPDPSFVANGSHGSPGDGFLIMGCAALGLVVSVSYPLRWRGLFFAGREAPTRNPTNCQIDPPLVPLPFDPPKKRVIR